MHYPREFFALNLEMAWKAAEVLRHPLDETLLQFTNLYRRFGLGTDLNPTHPVWQAYLAGPAAGEEGLDWTVSFYRQVAGEDQEAPTGQAFGCFSYSLWENQRIRLHFHNQEPPGQSGPLSRARMPARLAELERLAHHLEDVFAPSARVVGGSWLYHLEAYRRLFPLVFLASAHAGHIDFPHLTLWGQFIGSSGEIRSEAAAHFREKLAAARDLQGLKECFPYSVVYLECDLKSFCEYYHEPIRNPIP